MDAKQQQEIVELVEMTMIKLHEIDGASELAGMGSSDSDLGNFVSERTHTIKAHIGHIGRLARGEFDQAERKTTKKKLRGVRES